MNHRLWSYVLIISMILVKINYASRICFDNCKCNFGVSEIDCSGLGLTEVPDIPDDIPIERINFENNNLHEFPSYLVKMKSLSYLNLNGNQIGYLNENALEGFVSLRTLLMENNSFLTWNDLNPNTAFKMAPNLEHLSLAKNNVTSFSNPNESFLLISKSLLILDLSYCKIMKISGEYILSGMENLERLILNGNPIRSLDPIISSSLKILDLSDCNLVTAQTNSFQFIDKLISLDLSKNPGLNIVSTNGEYIKSNTVRYLDLSYCNLDTIYLDGFPNLNILQYAGNMLKNLQPDNFIKNRLLTVLNFSRNSINFIEQNTFDTLAHLKHTDLSYNELSRIDPYIFQNNEKLYSVNLSRNPFSRFSKIFSSSITLLNFSWCEIIKIDSNSLSNLLNITILDLSNNLISEFPSKMRSATLQDLNLDMCRISSINNATFANFPELTRLHLHGNRLTSSLKQSYFRNNLYLVEIWLGDNPWICECKNKDFRDFYDYLCEGRKIQDIRHLKCATPGEDYGKVWERVCYSVWFPNPGMANAEMVWSIIMGILISAVILTCIISTGKKLLKRRKRLQNERELIENIEEQRASRLRNDIILRERAQLNAPNAREIRPPCYEEAILLPKLERNFKSMDELSSKRTKLNIPRSSTNSNFQTNESVLDHYKSLASEERIEDRHQERTDDYRSTWKNKMWRAQSGSRIYSNEASNCPPGNLKAQNLQSAEQIAILQKLKTSPYSQKKWKMHGTDSVSFISISDDEMGIHRNSVKDCSDSIKHSNSNSKINKNNLSPYTRRRPRGLSVSQLSMSKEALADNHDDIDSESMPFVNDHFKSNDSLPLYKKKLNSSSSSSCFEIMGSSKDKLNSIEILNKPVEANIVIVHCPPKEEN